MAPTPSFYGSPEEARGAPPEEFLYLACLHEGTGVEAPDFLAVIDAESGALLHETSSTTTAGTGAARPATARIAHT
jgi:hypothetical protein